jgi:N-acyl homoserine lactone hydrolase
VGYNELIPVNVGEFTSFPLSRFLLGDASGEHVSAPCIAWVVKRPDGTVAVVDTGPPVPTPESEAIHQALVVGPSQRIDRALALAGVDPAEVSDVVFTHLHFDHCGGADTLPSARFHVFAEDRLVVHNGAYQLGAGCDVVPLPGHTPGSAGVLVSTRKGTVALCGDLVNQMENWSGPAGEPIPPGMFTDLNACRQSLSTLASEADLVTASHDWRTFERTWS